MVAEHHADDIALRVGPREGASHTRMAERASRRAAWILAAGCGVFAVIALGLALWLNRSPSAAAPISTAHVVKLLVADEGMVSVAPAQLGWEGIDPAAVQVKHDGVAQPVWVEGDMLRFYAPISPTRYMSETVFWLEQGDQPGTKIPVQPLAPAIVERCREMGMAGATVTRGVMGFGPHLRLHRAHMLGLLATTPPSI